MSKLKPEDYTMFKCSQPWGYYPPAVEEKIAKYESAIGALKEKYLEASQTNEKLLLKIDSLQEELRQMHIQMSSMELPEASEVVENCVLNDFKNYNSANNSEPKAPINMSIATDKEMQNQSELEKELGFNIVT